MSLVLCHHCLGWIEPVGEQCPECDYPVDTGLCDPPAAQLGVALGRLVGPIGDVRLSRGSLPEQGVLYETTAGLFFVPHRLERVRMVSDVRPGAGWTALLQSARRRLFSLFGFLPSRPGLRIEVAIDEHRTLGPHDSDKLPGLLMQNPAVFFLSRGSIHRVRWTFRGWMIARPNSLGVWLRPVGDRAAFNVRMTQLAAGLHEALCP